jgi:hypothetical protein
MREMRDPLLGAYALGDVLVRGHPPAIRQRLVHDLDRMSLCSLYDVVRDFAQRYVTQDRGAKTVNVALEGSSLLSICDKITKAEAGLYHVG